MGRTPCCKKVEMKKGSWTTEEDRKLVSYIEQHGPRSWCALPFKAGLQRCGKSCRLRWTNYLRPDIKRGKFTVEEEQVIIRLHALLGNKWSKIANHLPKRTDNEIKNYWNTHLTKKLTKMGIDPITHKRRIAAFGVNPTKNDANLSHMAQWENARLEAEGRLTREANKFVFSPNNQLVHMKSSARLVVKPTLPQLIPPQPLDVLNAWQGIMSSNISNRTSLESPISTLNFQNNTPTIPNVGFVDNQCLPLVNDITGMCDVGVMIMEQNIQRDSYSAEASFIPQTIKKEKMENIIELHEMVHPNSVYKEDFTKFDVANTYNLTENNYVDLEDNWNTILNDLANSLPQGSVNFLNQEAIKLRLI